MLRIRLALFPDSKAASPVRDRLVAEGIRAEVHHELHLQRLWFVSPRAAGARLEVPADSWNKAVRLVRDWEIGSTLLTGAIRCPDCGSMRVDYPQYTPKSFLTNLAIGMLAELRLIERQYYCEECHCMWSKQQAKRARGRLHEAPNYFMEGMPQDGKVREPAHLNDPSQA